MIHDRLASSSPRGRRDRQWQAVVHLAAFESRVLFRSRWGILLYVLCLLPGLARMVMLLIMFGVVRFGPPVLRSRLQQRLDLPDELDPFRVAFYLEPVLSVLPGLAFTMLLTSLVVARTIARDRLANALELYWTRGISVCGYVVGKWLGGFCLVATITTLLPIVLWLTAGTLAEDWGLLAGSAVGMLRAVGGLLLATAAWTSICLSISAIAASPNSAMVAWCMLLVGTSSLGTVLSHAVREPWLRSCLSLWEAGGVVVRAIAGVAQHDVSVRGATVTLLVLVLGMAWMASRRLRLAEAVQ